MEIIGGPPPNVVPHYREITAATDKAKTAGAPNCVDVGSLRTASWIGLFG